MAEMEDLKSAQSQPGYDQCALTSVAQRLLDAAKGLSFGAYPAHGSGFVCIVNGDLDAFRDAIAEADQFLSASPPPPAEPPVEGWRGIESAPRDGRHFFATGPQFAREEDRPEIVAPGTWFIGLARRVGDTIETESWRFKAAAITHWMPLPSPPLSAKDTSERNDLAGDDDKAKPSTSLGGGSRASVASSSLPDGRSAPQRKSEGGAG